MAWTQNPGGLTKGQTDEQTAGHGKMLLKSVFDRYGTNPRNLISAIVIRFLESIMTPLIHAKFQYSS